MATLALVEGTPLERATVIELVKEAVALDILEGNPTRAVSSVKNGP